MYSKLISLCVWWGGYAWILVRLEAMRRTKLNANRVNNVTPPI
jgi:hypothetical protein